MFLKALRTDDDFQIWFQNRYPFEYKEFLRMVETDQKCLSKQNKWVVMFLYKTSPEEQNLIASKLPKDRFVMRHFDKKTDAMEFISNLKDELPVLLFKKDDKFVVKVEDI